MGESENTGVRKHLDELGAKKPQSKRKGEQGKIVAIRKVKPLY